MDVPTLTLTALALAATLSIGVAAQMLLRRKDEKAMERLLYKEALALRWQACAVAAEVARRHVAASGFDDAFFAQHLLSPPLLYGATGALVLGRLPRQVLARLHYFHGQLAAARSRLERAGRNGTFDPSPYRLLSNLVRAHYELEPWVAKLQPRFGGPLEPEPDISLANRLVGAFVEESHESLAVAYCPADSGYPRDFDMP